jgi:glycosyltransferase involved in cell wall biosynthesis
MSTKNYKKDILVIADKPNWAYYQIQQFIVRSISEEYNVYCDFLCYNQLKGSLNPTVLVRNYKDKKKYQKIKKGRDYDVVIYLGFYFLDLIKVKWSSHKTIVGIFTDGYPPRNGVQLDTKKEFIEHYFSNVDAMVCGAPSILEIYKSDFKNCYFATLAYDLNHFKRKIPKEINNEGTFIIGFTGQLSRDFKGFYTHITPAVERLKKKYPGVVLKTRSEGPFETLPRFYDDVDLVIIASEADAGPSLFLEASLMGVPCISTKIGLVTEVLVDEINGFYVERNVDDIYDKLLSLYQNREKLFVMSQRIRQDFIMGIGGNQMKNKWLEMLNNVLK